MPYFNTTNISLSGVNNASQNVNTSDQSVVIQAELFTNTGYKLLVNVDAAASLTANIGMIGHGESMWIQTFGYTTIQFLLVSAGGVASSGGANDYVMYRGAAGKQVA